MYIPKGPLHCTPQEICLCRRFYTEYDFQGYFITLSVMSNKHVEILQSVDVLLVPCILRIDVKMVYGR